MNEGERGISWAVVMIGLFLLLVGFYLLPFGTDVFLYFFVEKIAHGDWFTGALMANAFCLGMILSGSLILRRMKYAVKR